jgi:hypothetical protein
LTPRRYPPPCLPVRLLLVYEGSRWVL